MLLDVTQVWCPDCIKFHQPLFLETVDHEPGELALRCPYGKPFNSTLMIIKEVADELE